MATRYGRTQEQMLEAIEASRFYKSGDRFTRTEVADVLKSSLNATLSSARLSQLMTEMSDCGRVEVIQTKRGRHYKKPSTKLQSISWRTVPDSELGVREKRLGAPI
jgi:hypothetical protein